MSPTSLLNSKQHKNATPQSSCASSAGDVGRGATMLKLEYFSTLREWRKQSKTFLLRIVHWTMDVSVRRSDDGCQRWNVEVYVYHNHPLFKSMNRTNHIGAKVFSACPLHCGNSMLRKHRNDKRRVVSVQFGSDYNHLYDSRFTFMTEPDAEILDDATALYDYLKGFEHD